MSDSATQRVMMEEKRRALAQAGQDVLDAVGEWRQSRGFFRRRAALRAVEEAHAAYRRALGRYMNEQFGKELWGQVTRPRVDA